MIPVQLKIKLKMMIDTALRASPLALRGSVTKLQREVDSLYRLLYNLSHDPDNAVDLASSQTRNAFAHQWQEHQTGLYLLSDPWFKSNVARILSEEELQISSDWFRGKKVLDAGCGNGRWSYGFSQLGCDITAVDANQIAIDETKAALADYDGPKQFHVCELERLSHGLGGAQFDLVFCWGVLHHCGSFTRGLDELVKRVAPGGVIYLYLYGRESISLELDIELFKQRLHYNCLVNEQERYEFLLQRSGGDPNQVHNMHDVYAPLINRRFEFAEVANMLVEREFNHVTRTIDHSEVYIRASRSEEDLSPAVLLPRKAAPFWFQHHS